MPLENAYDEAETGWQELFQAAQKILAAAARIKETERSFDGYEIERTLRRHRPELMKDHLEGLKQHRKEHGV